MQQRFANRTSDELVPGDVLLCFNDPGCDVIARLIIDRVGGPYCHAAIYYGGGLAAESRAKDGWSKGSVGKVPAAELVARYDYVAVIRHPDAWSTFDRVASLQGFIDDAIARDAQYNLIGASDLAKRREAHQAQLTGKLSAYFNGKIAPEPVQKARYFCSELVCDCFSAVGFLAPSAAVMYRSDTYAPADLARDPSFGTFWGYLSENGEPELADDDPFIDATTFDEIFGSSSA